MSRDKTATHQKLLDCMKEEFLKYGYEKATLKSIAKKAGITPAAIYRHFPTKESMFAELVEPVTKDFFSSCDGSVEKTLEHFSKEDFLEHYNEFRSASNQEFVGFMYDNYDIFRLLLVCSKGTCYENFLDRLISMEEKTTEELLEFMDQRGIPHKEVSKEQLHIVCATLVTAGCATVYLGYTREHAMEYVDFIGKMLYPGFQDIFGF